MLFLRPAKKHMCSILGSFLPRVITRGVVFLRCSSILKKLGILLDLKVISGGENFVASVQLPMRVENSIKAAHSTLRAEEIMVFIAFHKSYLLHESRGGFPSCFCTVNS